MALTYIPSRVQKIWRPRNRVFRYLVQLTIVGIAAQIGVGPLSVYYFHQFPLLFWLSNFIAIPLMTPILVLGLIITFGHILSPLPQIIYQMWNQIVDLMLSCIQWISGHDHFIVESLNLPFIDLFSYYLLILLLWWGLQHPWLSKRSLFRVVLPYSCSILLTAYIALKIDHKKTKPEFALLHHYGSTVMVAHTTEGYIGLSNDDQEYSKLWLNWTRHFNVAFAGTKKLPRITSLASRPVIVVDSLGIYPPIIDGIVILTDNANIHFETMVHEIKPYLILADGSNYKQVVARWRSRATELDQKFLDTYKLGAIVTHDPLFKNYF
jgi:competence protein ComEC